MPIDYRELLKRYMDHVGMNEGVFFLGEPRHRDQIKGVSAEGHATLYEIETELESEMTPPRPDIQSQP